MSARLKRPMRFHPFTLQELFAKTCVHVFFKKDLFFGLYCGHTTPTQTKTALLSQNIRFLLALLSDLITLTLCLIFDFTFLSAYFSIQEVTIETWFTCGQATIQQPAALTILLVLTIFFFFSQPIAK